MPRLLTALIVIVLLQGFAVGLYFLVEGNREKKEAFRYERLSGEALAPELILRRDGAALRLSEQRGELVLVHFWATWCEPCREELPSLLALSRELSIKLLAVSEDKDWKKVQEFFGGEVPPEIAWDASGEGEALYEVSALPDTYLISPQGKLLIRFGGARNWSHPQATKLLTSEIKRF